MFLKNSRHSRSGFMKNWFASNLIVWWGLSSPAWAASLSEGMSCLAVGDLSCAQEVRDSMVASAPAAVGTMKLNLRVLFREGKYSRVVEVLDALEAKGVDIESEDPSPYRATAAAAAGMAETVQGGVRVRHAGGIEQILEDDALSVLQASRRAYDALFGGGPGHEVLLDIFPTARRFIQASGLPPEAVRTTGVIALSKWSRLLISSPRSMGRGYSWKDTIAHEYIHLVVSVRSGDRSPVWLQEGLAKHLEPRWRDGSDSGLSIHQQSLIARAIQTGEFVPFEKFKHSMAYLDSGEETGLAFAQVSTMVGYLLAQGGDECLPGVLDRIRDGEASEVVVAEAAGHTDFEDFRSGWLEWLSSRPLIQEKIASLPVVLDGAGGSYAEDPLLAARADLARFARLGDLLRGEGRPLAALVEYRKAADPEGPPSPLLQAREATCLLELDQLQRAEAVAAEGARLYPEFTLLQVVHGRTLDALGMQRRALEAWKAAHDLNPFNPEVQTALAADYAAIGAGEEADQHRRYARILQFGGSAGAAD